MRKSTKSRLTPINIKFVLQISIRKITGLLALITTRSKSGTERINYIPECKVYWNPSCKGRQLSNCYHGYRILSKAQSTQLRITTGFKKTNIEHVLTKIGACRYWITGYEESQTKDKERERQKKSKSTVQRTVQPSIIPTRSPHKTIKAHLQ